MQPHSSEIAQATLQWMGHHQAEVVEWVRRAVEVESPSDDKAACDRMADFLAEEFGRIGGKVERHRRPRSGDHLEIKFGSELGGRPVLLLGHHDTVWQLGTLGSMPFRVGDGRIWGPGTLDMKVGLAQIFFALQALQRKGRISRPITLLSLSDEETGSASSRELIEAVARHAAAAFVMEPAQGRRGALKTARKGICGYTLKVTGRASHAGVDFAAGASAIVELARQIGTVSGFTNLKRGITVNPGVIRGGTRTNVVAEHAEAGLDVRFSKKSELKLIQKKFSALRAFDKGCKLEVEGGLNRPPMERTAKIAALFATAKKIASAIGANNGNTWRLEEAATGGGSDGSFAAALGIPTLDGLGAVGEGAHAGNESAFLAEIPRRTALLAALITSVK